MKRARRGQNQDAPSDQKRACKGAGPQTTALVDFEPISQQSIGDDVSKLSNTGRAPVVDTCPIKSSAEVFVDNGGVSHDASLSLSNIDGNNNKYYYIQLLARTKTSHDYSVWTHWGRVGEVGQSKLDGDLSLEAAKASFGKKFKDKTGLTWEKRKDASKAKKYAVIEKLYRYESEEELKQDNRSVGKEAHMPECTLSED